MVSQLSTSIHSIGSAWWKQPSPLLRLRCMVGGFSGVALVDSGATHCFIGRRFVSRNGLNFVNGLDSYTIVTADGTKHSSSAIIPSILVKIGEHYRTHLKFIVADIDEDIILGADWLKATNPHIDWDMGTVIVPKKANKPATVLQSIRQSDANADVESMLISSLQLKRMVRKGQEAYAIYLKQALDDDSIAKINAASASESDTSADNWTIKDGDPAAEALLQEYSDVFQTPTGLPPDRPVEHHIDIQPGSTPPFRQPYRMSTLELQELKKQLKDLLDRGYIQPSCSPYGAPVLFVRKKDGSMRLCVDYRALNKQTIRNRYPLPRVDDLIDALHGSAVYSKLDLASGYWQVKVHADDVHKTAFQTRYGQFEWLVLPFGLCNAPSTFQSLMHRVFHPHLDKFVVIYLDDILVYSKNMDEHVEHLRQVLKLLRKHKLYAKAKKCAFAQESIEFLGHIISKDGVQVDANKVKSMVEWPKPEDASQLRSFLGLCGFYRRFVPGFSKVTVPLTELLKDGVDYKWDFEQRHAFDTLKGLMVKAPVLKIANPNAPFVIHTDCSDFALGAVIMQEYDGKLHPVAYHSRKLIPAEMNYPVHERELLAVVDSVKQWEHYLEGAPVTIHTDHESLKYFWQQKKLSKRQARWLEALQALDLNIQYVKGKLNLVADALSRRHDYQVNAVSVVDLSPFVLALRSAGQIDLNYSHQKELIQQGLLHGYEISDDIIYQVKPSGLRRVVIPDDDVLKLLIMSELHDAPTAGHFSFVKTLRRISSQFVWPHIAKDIKELTKMVRCIPTTINVDGPTVAKLFRQQVVRLFGVPKIIVSDRDTKFMSEFWRALFASLGTRLNFSSSYHPESDGQTERVNRTLQQVLRCYAATNPSSWEQHLDLVEFAMNSAQHASTGLSPFYLMYGYQPETPISLTNPLHSSRNNKVQAAADMLQQMAKELALAQDLIKEAQDAQAAYANKGRREHTFAVGDSVMLSTKNLSFPKGSSKKLLPKFVGPFEITEVINPVAMKLDLPSNIGLHPVVHTSYLKPWVTGTKWDRQPPDPGLDVIEIPPLQEKCVATILSDKTIHGSSETRYLVHWKDTPIYDATWHNKSDILEIDPSAVDMLDKYDKVMYAYRHNYVPGDVDTHLDTFSSSDEEGD
eukprot:jgi/Chrzof1/8529/Cz03g14150.t1